VPIKLCWRLAWASTVRVSALIGTLNSRPQNVQTATTGVELSHLTTLRLRRSASCSSQPSDLRVWRIQECIQFRFQFHLFWTVFLICERPFFFLAARCLLTAALAPAIVVRPKLIFLLSHAHNCHRAGKSSQPHGNRGTECGFLTVVNWGYAKAPYRFNPEEYPDSRRRLARYRACSRRRGHVGRQRLPVESAFVSGDARGWRAAAPGSQTIRLVFDQPQRLNCISLVFEENELPARRNSFCDGLRMSEALSKKLCDNNGISVHLTRYVRSKNIKSSFQALQYLNWSSIRISLAESRAPQLRISVCLDVFSTIDIRSTLPNRCLFTLRLRVIVS